MELKTFRLQTSLYLPIFEQQNKIKAHIQDLRQQPTSRKCPGLSSQCPVLFISLPRAVVPNARELFKKNNRIFLSQTHGIRISGGRANKSLFLKKAHRWCLGWNNQSCLSQKITFKHCMLHLGPKEGTHVWGNRIPPKM